MKTLLITTTAVFVVSLLDSPVLGAAWFWDLGNGFGFAAFSGLLYLSLASARAIPHEAHRHLAYAVLLLVALHVFWLLLGDAVVVEYLRPGAPLYMWVGLAGFALLNLLMLVSLPRYRPRIHWSRADFRRWHRASPSRSPPDRPGISWWRALSALATPVAGIRARLRLSLASRTGLAGDNNDRERRSSRRYLRGGGGAAALFTLVRNTPS
ncbi:MAG: hypothetical protein IPG20_00115 [Gammaproteobacteria bacterium]|nr:hypothetical protein [Gammaproteobacteria bacterium]